MSEQHVYPVPPEVAAAAHCDNEKYLEMYKRSVEDPEGFWDAQGRRIDWIKPYTQVKDVSFAPGNISINWYADGTLNVAANCIDRHLPDKAVDVIDEAGAAIRLSGAANRIHCGCLKKPSWQRPK
mgnify:CR=1 FL=1